MIFEDGAVDDALIGAEVAGLRGRIFTSDDAAEQIGRIIRETGSVALARHVAAAAVADLAVYLLSDDLSISIVPAPAGNLARFIRDARMQIARFAAPS